MPRLASVSRRMRSFPQLVSLIALAALPIASRAASFDCAKAASPTEKTICATPALSRLDSDLAAAWKAAIAQSHDAAALKNAQRQWLRLRDACGEDKACVSDRYHERLAALTGAPLAANRWDQTWTLDSGNPTRGGSLTFTGTAPHLHFSISGYNGGHTGANEGDITLQGDTANYRDAQGCRLTFTRQKESIGVTEASGADSCGEGMGVSFGGRYLTFVAINAKPSADLVSLNVLSDRKADDAARALLGNDYDALISTINLSNDAPDLDHLGAKVRQFFVRGLATTNASIVMSHGGQLWIGLLVFDANDKVRMRYYTNAPAWKKAVPKTILAWHDQIDRNLPIDMMR
ncbi:MAG TPA: lysozyme inhibitor LprI family protein [Trinickia sp.]|nr:lysozyme inhibitor LprI family protein [Trinickia sp.]